MRHKALMRQLNIVAYLRSSWPRISDPGAGQRLAITGMKLPGRFGDPVSQTLTGAPSSIYRGETRTPQTIRTYPRIDVSVDLASGTGVNQYPSLPSPRGARGGRR